MTTETLMKPTVIAARSQRSTDIFGVKTQATLPDTGWSDGNTHPTKGVRSSNVTLAMMHDMTITEHFDSSTARYFDSRGVTADQFYEAWDLMGSLAFSLASASMDDDIEAELLNEYLEDSFITRDVRFACYLVAPTIKATPEEMAAGISRLGYNGFFEYAAKGFDLDQIIDILENDIDPAILNSFFSGDFS